ncbi:class I SAM-dependent methyltransferase [Flavobacterium phycosphaerae]|uniref:class I SAM-dependent methyltransferase n=1 Tax=Flavobacterium phycosphaerae TaxID=2697515 RepID=UPI00138A6BB1|nr:class I SAM-dependent methyltransferase [Flavobacterium phycosphaerae]
MEDNQKQAWLDYSKGISIDHIKHSFTNPTNFQVELNSLLQKTVKENHFKNAIEIGCEAGISLMLLSKNLEQATFLDYDHTILEKVEKVCADLNFNGTNCICEDMFTMNSIADNTYDLAYNSGVIEHYTKEVRTKAIISYARITKKGGYVIVAYPNHHTLPYRLSYLIGRMLGKKVWPWPKEYKFYSLKDEMEAAGLEYVERITMDRDSLFGQWITKYKITSKFFLFLDKFMHFEGYLTVCIAKKPL